MRSAATRKLFSVLVILWANLALQPCAVAAGADHECPHCPPAHEDETSAHHGHHQQKEAAQPCASMQSDCCDQETSNVGPRGSDLKAKGFSEQPALVAEISPWLDARSIDRPVSATGPPLPVAASPPLHVLHCVYLK